MVKTESIIKKKVLIKKKPSKIIASKTSKIHSKITQKPLTTQTHGKVKVEKILIENFVSLQKVMTNLSIKFDSLTNQISRLLELFEISAKALAEKEFNLEKVDRDDKKIINKIDNLLEQNKTIARGLTLMHERIPGQEYNSYKRPLQMKTPLLSPISKPQTQTREMEEYQKSSPPKKFSESSDSSKTAIQKFKSLPK